MLTNYFTLNISKTEFLLIGLPRQTSQIINPSLSFPLYNLSYQLSLQKKTKKNLIFDPTLSFSQQISSLSSFCHYHIRYLRRIRHTTDFTTSSTIGTTLVHSWLEPSQMYWFSAASLLEGRSQEWNSSLSSLKTFQRLRKSPSVSTNHSVKCFRSTSYIYIYIYIYIYVCVCVCIYI